ncbi:MAG: DUF4142 domain-containing protein [Nitrospirae bacterium]|nr:DUF4142 domain-containing protein [Nitrospirota bacterium]
MKLHLPATLLAMVCGALLSGCSLSQPAVPVTTFSDSNVLAMLDTINLSEINAASLARQKASSPDTRMFAARMLNEHTRMLQQMRHLARRIHIQPQPPALALQATKTHQTTMEELRNLSDRDFDRAYLKYQIRMHEQALNLVQDTARSVESPQLQQHLRQAHPDLEGHLSAAKAIERQLVAQYLTFRGGLSSKK